jgi:hypothetical protein
MTNRGATPYRATFMTKGITGWSSPDKDDWSVNRKGILTFGRPRDGGLEGEIFAPVQTRAVRDFAVQATIKAVGNPYDLLAAGYGVIVRHSRSPSSGIRGGVQILNSYQTPVASLAQLAWGYDDVGGGLADVHPGYNTFLLVVHKTDFTLFINGTEFLQFTIPDYSDGTRVGLWSIAQKLQVKSFEVMRLRTFPPLPAMPPVKALNLGPSDLPGGFLLGHYSRRTDWTGSADPARVATLNSEGFIIDYGVTFTDAYAATDPAATDPIVVSSDVIAFTSPQGAQQELMLDWPSDQVDPLLSGATNLVRGDVNGLGDEAHQRSYDYGNAADGYTIVDVLFRRGTYGVRIQEWFHQDKVSRPEVVARATALARIVDGRIQQVEWGL